MTGFLIGAALLIATSLVFLLPPLLRKEQVTDAQIQRDELNLAVLRDQLRELDADLNNGIIDPSAYESARHELERRVAEEVRPDSTPKTSGENKRRTAVAVGLMVPVLAIAIYMVVGTPAALDPTQQVAGNENAHQVTQEQIESMVATLEQRMQNEPDNVEGWTILARTYSALGRYQQANEAYARLVKLVPNDASLYADYADTLAMAMDRSLQGGPEKLIERALAIDPKNIKALALSGSAAYERKDYALAAERWQKILPLVPPDSEMARSVTGNIAEVKGLMGQAPSAPAQKSSAKQAAGEARVSGTVDIDPALRAQAADTDTVFIFARAATGPRIPLAVLRKQVKDLPVEFILDDSMSMTPEAKLSTTPMVVVGARVSKTGNAMPQAGDLEGMSEPVAPGATDLKIRINKKNG
ncbi:MAG TPA: c-type cytochrome biogenesis protein CcmI [Noviherbaspirillum sp.]|nr:c-type cytochrome biogenesis protein CcmI [Noviherbaspirillum sp.]